MLRRRLRARGGNPAQLVVVAFVAFISIGTILLALPLATDGSGAMGWENALFLATSAATVTGLITIDAADLSAFGELVVLGLVQIGGFGIMTVGSVLALVASRRIGLRQRLAARAEIGAVDSGDLRGLIAAIAKITLAVEGTVAVILFLRLWQRGDDSVGAAGYSAVFHSITAFNNAGLSLYSDNLERFVGDPVVILTISAAFIVGGFGFPVFVEMQRRVRDRRELDGPLPRPWSVHARLMLLSTAVLLVVGPVVVMAFEWTNPGTLGPLDFGDKLLAGWFQGASPRTAGFNTVDIGAMNEPTLLVISTLMFIGAGPASTSGGIKVTTFAILGFVMWSEVRGEADVNVFRRRLPGALVRQAITVALLAIGMVIATSLALMAFDELDLTAALFESTSAFGTVGLSTGSTGIPGTFGHLLLIIVMLAGRVGPVTFVTALMLRERPSAYRFPEERPIIG